MGNSNNKKDETQPSGPPGTKQEVQQDQEQQQVAQQEQHQVEVEENVAANAKQEAATMNADSESPLVDGVEAPEVQQDAAPPVEGGEAAGKQQDGKEQEMEEQVTTEAAPKARKGVKDLSDTSDSDDEDFTMEPQERIARAESAKETGNDNFKTGKLEQAVKFYHKGIIVLKPIEEDEPPTLMESMKEKQVALSLTLHLNKATAENRLEAWVPAIKSSTTALEMMEKWKKFTTEHDKSKVKALFRRAFARSRSGELEDAKDDLVALLRIDRSNKDAMKEYNRVKQLISKQKAAEKKQFAAAFQKVSQTGGMYADVEAAKKRKQLEKIEQERLRREQWKKEIAASGEEDLSFDDWCKRDDEKKEEEKKKLEEAEKERRRLEMESRKQQQEEERRRKKESGDTSDVELDEEDLKILEETRKKGYCYFRKELTEEEKKLKAENTPMRLDQSGSSESTESTTAATSAWNANGTTWEERDITDRAKEGLETKLSQIVYEGQHDGKPLKIKISKVESVDGHAQIVVSRGKPAPVYDLSVKCKWELTLEDAKQASGTIELPDIHTGGAVNDCEISTTCRKSSKLASDTEPVFLQSSLTQLRKSIRKNLAHFLAEMETY